MKIDQPQENSPKKETKIPIEVLNSATSFRYDTKKEGILYQGPTSDGEGASKIFELHKNLGGLKYIFLLYPDNESFFKDAYGINFKTEEYDYAFTRLKKEDAEELGLTLKNILDAINAETNIIGRLIVRTADHEYTIGEIEACKKVLLEKGIEKFILDHMEGFEVLRKYKELTKENFPLEKKDLGFIQRDRLFRILANRYFPEWKIEESPHETASFNLVAPWAKRAFE